jgi:hypothetical protein
LVAYAVCERVAWVFKTETVIMPAFLDAVGGSGFARGLLPVLSRLGSSLPQYLLAPSLQTAPRIAAVLAFATFGQAVPWLVLGGLCLLGEGSAGGRWIVGFLVGYTVFWIANGMVLLTQGLLQGKLVPYLWRGRLLAVSNSAGAAAGIAAIVAWMVPTMRTGPGVGAGGFAAIFLATGSFFALSAGWCLALSEPTTATAGPGAGWRDFLRASIKLLRGDADYRRLTAVLTMHYMLLALVPHFASFSAQRLGSRAIDLAIWVIVQNIGTALGSALWGPTADRKGNRFVLQLLLASLALAPLIAVVFSELPPGVGRSLYWLVFVILGFMPVSQRIYVNYLLELAPADEHPRYLGTFHLWQCVAVVFAPLVGWLVDLVSYQAVFLFGSACIIGSAFLAGRLTEPRDVQNDVAAAIASTKR